jgi:hypothetical protein
MWLSLMENMMVLCPVLNTPVFTNIEHIDMLKAEVLRLRNEPAPQQIYTIMVDGRPFYTALSGYEAGRVVTACKHRGRDAFAIEEHVLEV